MAAFNAYPITKHVYWVGAIDWEVRDFHGYATSRGTTYNAFLIVADSVVLIDTVKAPFREQMFSRIASVIDPAKIDYIVSNHAEMDHSGCLADAIERAPSAQVYASAMGTKALKAHFGIENVSTAPNGETLSLGGVDLHFLETRMLHWPDSMFTWYAEDGVLFTSDAFGMHLASTERHTDELPWWVIEREAGKYFANILMPLSKLVLKLLDQVGELDLPIKALATDHGPIWRQDFDRILGLYTTWATRKPTPKALVVYDSMWGSTATMAEAVAEGLIAGGATPKLMRMDGSHRSDVATELLDAGALLVGSPTLNRNLFPTMADVMTYLKGLAPKNLVGGAFGSYGWSSQAVKQLTTMLTDMGVEIVADAVDSVYVPTEAVLTKCHALGRQTADRLAALAAE